MPDRDPLPLGYGTSYLLDSENIKKGIICIFRDLTEIRESQRAVKVRACINMKNKLEAGRIKLKSKDTISELSTFVDNGNQVYKAEEGNHDDCVLALVWAIFASHKDVMEELDLEYDEDDDNENAVEEEAENTADDAMGIFSSNMITAEQEMQFISHSKFSEIFGR